MLRIAADYDRLARRADDSAALDSIMLSGFLAAKFHILKPRWLLTAYLLRLTGANIPIMVAWREYLLAGLRKAGMPEE